ncbi:hypothetical protein GIB67_002608 [Kingdonia uniflora]|uniref:Uncharacterized protein n=1 Tax=Kingdonia uniflora TaxID=39325 RepID=A0A7J7N499_9MAGN|nr:hypothetical protein GIB67_002608 [Kingdonia uniflora]
MKNMMEPTTSWNSSPMKMKVMFPKCDFYRARSKITYEELNVSTEPSPLLLQNYEPRDFRRLTQSDGKGHLSTSVVTTSARVRFKCRSVLVKLRETYLILIEVPHLKHKFKATN